jgi:hypothetical protein
MVSEPEAKRAPDPDRAPASETTEAAEAVLMKSRRVRLFVLSFALFIV